MWQKPFFVFTESFYFPTENTANIHLPTSLHLCQGHVIALKKCYVDENLLHKNLFLYPFSSVSFADHV